MWPFSSFILNAPFLFCASSNDLSIVNIHVLHSGLYCLSDKWHSSHTPYYIDLDFWGIWAHSFKYVFVWSTYMYSDTHTPVVKMLPPCVISVLSGYKLQFKVLLKLCRSSDPFWLYQLKRKLVQSNCLNTLHFQMIHPMLVFRDSRGWILRNCSVRLQNSHVWFGMALGIDFLSKCDPQGQITWFKQTPGINFCAIIELILQVIIWKEYISYT